VVAGIPPGPLCTGNNAGGGGAWAATLAVAGRCGESGRSASRATAPPAASATVEAATAATLNARRPSDRQRLTSVYDQPVDCWISA